MNAQKIASEHYGIKDYACMRDLLFLLAIPIFLALFVSAWFSIALLFFQMETELYFLGMAIVGVLSVVIITIKKG